MDDKWDSGAAYEAYVGRWSRLVAQDFLGWLDLPPGLRWLDIGCGTGILSRSILQTADPAIVLGIDSSPEMVNHARIQVIDQRVSFDVGDAQQFLVPVQSYDVIVSGLVLNFIPDQSAAVQAMLRAIQPGGVLAAYVWDYADQMQLMRYFWDAVNALHPTAGDYDEGRRFPICHPAALGALWTTSGLEQVAARAIDIPTHFKDFADYWLPFLGGTGSAPTYLLSLPEPDQFALRDYLQAHLPFNSDGSLDLIARAWAVRGVRP